jgi:hypothetical protein
MSDTPINDAWTAGYVAGVLDGYAEGYRDGYPKGVNDAQVRTAIHIENGLPALTPHEFDVWRAKRNAGPCDDPKCGACGVRRDAVARQGGDYPGRDARTAGISRPELRSVS